MKKNFTILAIDTSCDDTSAAVTADKRVLANICCSQIEFHQQYGGVVPHLAKRAHLQMIDPVIAKALKKAGKGFKEIDAVAVTYGPGLAPALEVGIAKAKELALKFKKPLINVNHMEGHLLSSWAKNSQGKGSFIKNKPQYPILGLLVSGGHTQLILIKALRNYQLLGETLDDAAGEAFDKVAKMLELGYPGGPIISRLALKGKSKYKLPIPMQYSKDLNFSFSGLKTACLYKLKTLKIKRNRQFYADFCRSFEKTAIKALSIKLEKAIKIFKPKQIVLGGGVMANLSLRKEARRVAKKFGLKVFVPFNKKLFTDNAAMIGVCAYFQAKKGDFVKDLNKLDRQPNLSF